MDGKDHVRCNWCMKESDVAYDSDTCPHCGRTGYLMDIEGVE